MVMYPRLCLENTASTLRYCTVQYSYTVVKLCLTPPSRKLLVLGVVRINPILQTKLKHPRSKDAREEKLVGEALSILVSIAL